MPAEILFLTDDLMFTGRVSGAAEAGGYTLQSVGTAEEVLSVAAEGGCRLLIVDLGSRELQLAELVAALPGTPPPAVLAYGAHVDEERLEAARAAGCALVVPRGQFSSTLPQLLDQFLANG